MTPPYWINMGAVAITTLAGANILINGNAPFLVDLIPFIKGFTIFFWASSDLVDSIPFSARSAGATSSNAIH